MNKYLLLLILPLLSLVMSGCDDNKDDVVAPDLTLFAGIWEVVSPGEQKVFGWNEILQITFAGTFEGNESYKGYINTYLLTALGTPKHDRVFTWSIREAERHQPLLDVVYQGELDSDDPWAGNYPYKIVKLTDTHMWWQVYTNGDNSIIMLKRRNDINIE